MLVTSTDGVGTKIEIANLLNKYDTIGIDLVAMCVNDLIVQGATPLLFLDYISINKIDLKKLKFSLNGDEISISDTLKVFACKSAVEKIIINRRNEVKYIYTFCNINNLLIIDIIYTNEKRKIYL